MENWSLDKNKRIKTPILVENYLNEIEKISKKYGFSLSHEDGHGAFIVTNYHNYNIEWLKDCFLQLNDEE